MGLRVAANCSILAHSGVWLFIGNANRVPSTIRRNGTTISQHAFLGKIGGFGGRPAEPGGAFAAQWTIGQRTLSTIEKGRLTSFSIRTRRLSLPIISSLKALLARRLFHPRTPTRSFVSLLGACLLESGTTALVFARSIMSPRRLAGSVISTSRR